MQLKGHYNPPWFFEASCIISTSLRKTLNVDAYSIVCETQLLPINSVNPKQKKWVWTAKTYSKVKGVSLRFHLRSSPCAFMPCLTKRKRRATSTLCHGCPTEPASRSMTLRLCSPYFRNVVSTKAGTSPFWGSSRTMAFDVKYEARTREHVLMTSLSEGKKTSATIWRESRSPYLSTAYTARLIPTIQKEDSPLKQSCWTRIRPTHEPYSRIQTYLCRRWTKLKGVQWQQRVFQQRHAWW